MKTSLIAYFDKKKKAKKENKRKKQNTSKQTKNEKQVKSTTIEASIVFRLMERFIEMTNKDIFVKTILLWQLMDVK